MNIRFVSSLTADDENAFAPALLTAIGALLDTLPIPYTIRIETSGGQVFQHAHAPAAATAKPAESRAELAAGPLAISGGPFTVIA